MKTLACSAAHPKKRRAAFTLIELMIVVAIIGILAALGIPVFRTMLLRSKTAEASTNLNTLFKNVAAYYATERAGGQGQDAALMSGCTIGEVVPSLTPQAQKQRLPPEDGFRAIGFSVADYTYFVYGVANELTPAGDCGSLANNTTVYTLYAHGDLDGDGAVSTFELAVGSDDSNQLYHARGLYIENELE